MCPRHEATFHIKNEDEINLERIFSES